MKMYIVKKSEYKPLKGKRIGLQSIGGRKNPNPTWSAPKWFQDYEIRNNERLDKIESRLDEQANLLNKVIKLNNLKTE